MVNIEKHLIEVEACRKDHIKRDNTFTVAVLEQASEVAKELMAYREAEETGKLFSVPCRIGDRVHCLIDEWNELDCDSHHFCEIKVVGFSVQPRNSKECLVMHLYFEESDINPRTEAVFIDDVINKTVFITQEAKLRKLEEMKGDECG